MDRKAWFILVLCLVGIGLNGWWMVQHPQPKPVPPAPSEAAPAAVPVPGAAPATAPVPPAATPVSNEKIETVEIANDEARFIFTTKGGGIDKAVMLTTEDHPELNRFGRGAIGSLSGAAMVVDDYNYRIVSKSAKGVIFEAENPSDHMLIRKEYSLTEGKGSDPHLLNFKLTLTNKNPAGGTKIVKDSLYLYTGAAASLRPDEIIHPGFCWNNAGDEVQKDTNYFSAGMFSAAKPDVRQTLDSIRWAGVMSRFYAQVISPMKDQAGAVWAERIPIDHSGDEFKDNSSAKKDFAIHGGMGLPLVSLEPGSSQIFDMRIYLGAKVFRDLARIDDVDPDRQLRYVMFYGWFTKVSQFLVWLMRVFHDLFSNWGIAIILLTITIRSCLWPVQAKSNASMKRMGLLAPKQKEIQAKYKDQPQKAQQEVMKLYKEYGVNPIGGCLPMLIQIPVFFGFYRALQYAAELRGQHFLWVHDLSIPDTVGHVMGFAVNPLPLVMVITNFLQMKLTPQPPTQDPAQRRIFMFMPLIFLFICYNFASALALYWTTQNIFSILQAQIQRRYGKQPTLEKRALVEVPPRGGSGGPAPATAKKNKPGPPRLGGGGTKSTRKD